MFSPQQDKNFYKNLYPKQQWDQWNQSIDKRPQYDNDRRTIVGRKMSQGNKNSDGSFLDPREDYISSPQEEYHIIK